MKPLAKQISGVFLSLLLLMTGCRAVEKNASAPYFSASASRTEARAPAERLRFVGYDGMILNGEEICLLPGMMLDPGGNIQAIGAKPDGSPWRQERSFDMILITKDGEILLTEGITEKFTLDSYKLICRSIFTGKN